MNSKEALNFIIKTFNKLAQKPQDIGLFFKFCEAHEKVKQDLDRLEKLEKENFELRQKLNTEEECCVMLEKKVKEMKEAINVLKDRLIDYQGMEFQKRWYDGEEEYHYFLAFNENFEIELIDENQYKLLIEVFKDV